MFKKKFDMKNKKILSQGDMRQRALARWENEGGAPLSPELKTAERKINYRHHSSKIED